MICLIIILICAVFFSGFMIDMSIIRNTEKLAEVLRAVKGLEK